MAGYFTYYPAERIQLLGKTELSFFKQLDDEQKKFEWKKMCKQISRRLSLFRVKWMYRKNLLKLQSVSQFLCCVQALKQHDFRAI